MMPEAAKSAYQDARRRSPAENHNDQPDPATTTTRRRLPPPDAIPPPHAHPLLDLFRYTFSSIPSLPSTPIHRPSPSIRDTHTHNKHTRRDTIHPDGRNRHRHQNTNGQRLTQVFHQPHTHRGLQASSLPAPRRRRHLASTRERHKARPSPTRWHPWARCPTTSCC